jgi:hypothetical protein
MREFAPQRRLTVSARLGGTEGAAGGRSPSGRQLASNFIQGKTMRRADIVGMIRPLQLALALTPVIALVLPFGATHAASQTVTDPFVVPIGAPSYAQPQASCRGNRANAVMVRASRCAR